MSNVIDFKKKCGRPITEQVSTNMLSLDVFMDQDGMYEVYMEINDEFTDEQIGDAMLSASMKYMHDHDLMSEYEMELDPEDD